MTQDGKISPVIYLLFAGLLIFAAAALFCSIRLNQDNVTFNFLSGIALAFLSALTALIVPHQRNEPPAPPGTSVTKVTETQRVTLDTPPADPPKQ